MTNDLFTVASDPVTVTDAGAVTDIISQYEYHSEQLSWNPSTGTLHLYSVDQSYTVNIIDPDTGKNAVVEFLNGIAPYLPYDWTIDVVCTRGAVDDFQYHLSPSGSVTKQPILAGEHQ